MNTFASRLLLGTALTALSATVLMGCNKAPDATADSRSSPSTMGTQAEKDANPTGAQADNSTSPKAASADMSAKMDDATVTGRVKSALMAEPSIQSLDINVITYKGEVQLTGFVDNQSQIEQATKIARATDGAGVVKNELRIKQ